MGDGDDPPEVPEPAAPFTPEDGVYQAIVSEYVGLQRAGADPLGAALITAAHLVYLGIANSAAQPAGEPEALPGRTLMAGSVVFTLGTLTPDSVSHLSLQYVYLPVAATVAGATYNPTSDTVQWAFMPTPTQVPGSSDWQTGSWDTVTTNVIFPYAAKCLVGPAGTINLGIGTYTCYLKITDSPEIPVLLDGQLQVS